MQERGTKTTVPAMYETESNWILRPTATKSGVTIEDETRLPKATTSFAAAKQKMAEMKAELHRQLNEQHDDGTPRILGDWASQWFVSLAERKKKIKKSFFVIRRHYLEKFILPTFGERKLASIKTSDVERWKDTLAALRQPAVLRARNGKTRKNANGGEPYSHETLLSIWTTAKMLFAFAYRRSDLGHINPMRDAAFDIEGRERTPKEPVTSEELARMLEFAHEEHPKFRPMIMLQVTQGMRHAEASALHWQDLDLVTGRFSLVRSQVNGEVGVPKTDATRRNGSLLPEVVEALREYREWYEAEEPPGSEVGIMFPSRTGGYMQPNVVSEVLRRCALKAGVDKHISSHCLRATAVNLYRQTSDGATARKMVGHAKNAEEMTVRYSKADDEERIAIQRRAFGGALKGAR